MINKDGKLSSPNQYDEHESGKWRRRRKRMKRRKRAPWVGSSQKGIARDRKKCLAAIERMEKEERRGPKKYKGKCKCECGKEMAANNE